MNGFVNHLLVRGFVYHRIYGFVYHDSLYMVLYTIVYMVLSTIVYTVLYTITRCTWFCIPSFVMVSYTIVGLKKVSFSLCVNPEPCKRACEGQ